MPREDRAMFMRSYGKNTRLYDLLGEAVNIFYTGEVQHDVWSRDLQLLGLQGSKMWHEMQSDDDRKNRRKIQCMAIDVFGVDLEIEKMSSIKNVSTISEYLKQYLDWEINVYEEINRIARELEEMGYGLESEDIKEDLNGVRNEIKHIRRKMQSMEQTGYDMMFIKMEDEKLKKKIKKMKYKEIKKHCKCGKH